MHTLLGLGLGLSLWFSPARSQENESSAPAAPTSVAPSRFELGQRLRRLERAVGESQDLATRQAILPHMEAAVRGFFGMQPLEVAKALDRAYLAVLGAPAEGAAEAGRAALSRVLRAERFLEQAQGIAIGWPALYAQDDPQLAVPEGQVGWSLSRFEGPTVARGEVPFAASELRFDWPEGAEPGDFDVRLELAYGEQTMEIGRMGISWIPDRKARCEAVSARLASSPQVHPQTKATIEFGLELLEQAFERQNLEMDLPASQILQRLERAVEHPEVFEVLPPQGGETWIRLVGDPKGRAHLRVFAPERAGAKLRPCVIALHGAGGSENLFFDGYGDGRIVELCRERGWVLLAPRAGFAGIGLSFEQMLDAVQGPLAIDPERVVLVGHSMGVAASMAALREPSTRTRYRAVVALGGGMGGKFPAARAKTRFLCMTGSADFARRGVLSMHAALLEQGFESTLEELEAVEHMGLVQFALPRAFAFFDEN